MKPRVYLETSLVPYPTGRLSHDIRVLGDQFSTRDWWREARARFELAASPRVVHEEGVGDLRLAHDVCVRQLFAVTHSSNVSEDLLRRFTNSRALPQATTRDAGHIDIGITNGVEYLATWNFRHIANVANASEINRVCRDASDRPTTICTPRQLIEIGNAVTDDPMIAEIRQYRDSEAARFGYDAVAITRHGRALYGASGPSSVQYPLRHLKANSAPGQSPVSQLSETGA